MSLIEQVEKLWTDETESMVAKWAEQLKSNKQIVIAEGKKFHEWGCLHVYTSFTRAINSKKSFSLRYMGQEVGTLVMDNNAKLVIPKKTAESNKRFGFEKQGDFPWKSAEAKQFRQHFNKLNPHEYAEKVRVKEHVIESEFLKQMADPTSNKFAGSMRNIQPVLLAGCPFQFPLPFSGNTGEPVRKNGNIDILARRGSGKGTKISVWELKKPGTTAHAIEQAYIYTVTLIKMLRSSSGLFWYQDILGFSGNIPKSLVIECVVAVSLGKGRPSFEEKLRKFKVENMLPVHNDRIEFYIAHYEENPLRVDLQSY